MFTKLDPSETTRAGIFGIFHDAPNPMLTFFKTIDVTNLVRISRKKHLKFNMLLSYCVGKAAAPIEEFYLLPLDKEILQYDSLAVGTIVKNKDGGLNNAHIEFNGSLDDYNQGYLTYTAECAEKCEDRFLYYNSMVIGTSAIIDCEIDGAVHGYNYLNNPFIIWSRYKKKWFRYYLTVSFQFNHCQMDGSHAARFLGNLQNEAANLKV